MGQDEAKDENMHIHSNECIGSLNYYINTVTIVILLYYTLYRVWYINYINYNNFVAY